MIREPLIRATLAAALVTALPIGTSAQDPPANPEGGEWQLTSYRSGQELMAVPGSVDATLLLADGESSGSFGCNDFAGDYTLDETALSFQDFSVTVMACLGEAEPVERAVIAALPQVRGWSISDGGLSLSDELDQILLTFEIPGVTLTRADFEALQTRLDELEAEVTRANERIDNLSIGKLRDRIKVLEADNRTLKDQIAAVGEPPRTTPSANAAFTKAERILLEGVPGRIAGRCKPARNELVFGGTVASVVCTPNTTAVATVQYFLLDGRDAAQHFETTVEDIYSVPPASGNDTCATGKRAWQTYVGNGWQSEACHREPGPLVHLFFVDNATNCRELKVAGGTLRSPAFLVSITANHNQIKRAYDWATKSRPSGQIQSTTQRIARPGAKLSPSCPT